MVSSEEKTGTKLLAVQTMPSFCSSSGETADVELLLLNVYCNQLDLSSLAGADFNNVSKLRTGKHCKFSYCCW